MAEQSLAGRTALVTGASGAIGSAIASELAAAGANLLVHYNSNADAAGQLTQAISDSGGQARPVGADLSSKAGVDSLFAQIDDFGWSIQILVNNAGITRDGLLARMSPQDWQAVIDTNLTSAYLTCRAALRPMVRARWGRIINIASVAGISGNAGQANYSAAKAGLIGFTRALARELGPRNITANAIAPGFIESPMARAISPAVLDKVLALIPLGRLGEPDEVAGLVGYLASNRAGYITGQALVVDGGLVM